MVDFQSRDTRRGTDDEDEDEAVETDDSETGADDETTSEEVDLESEQAEAADAMPDTFTYAVVTVTDDRTVEDDATGDAVVDAVEAAGDGVATRELVASSYDNVQSTLSTLPGRKDVDAIVTVGGTGVEPDDVTVEAAASLFDKRLPGFGELFRVLSHDHDGTAVVRTRATAGLIDGVPVFCLPGEGIAARRGVEQIVLVEAPEIVDLADSGDEPE